MLLSNFIKIKKNCNMIIKRYAEIEFPCLAPLSSLKYFVA